MGFTTLEQGGTGWEQAGKRGGTGEGMETTILPLVSKAEGPWSGLKVSSTEGDPWHRSSHLSNQEDNKKVSKWKQIQQTSALLPYDTNLINHH